MYSINSKLFPIFFLGSCVDGLVRCSHRHDGLNGIHLCYISLLLFLVNPRLRFGIWTGRHQLTSPKNLQSANITASHEKVQKLIL